jgi:hypothetical protein
MDILGWLWWLGSTLFTGVLSLIWFLISGWVSALLQIGFLVGVIYFLKYGWQRAPAEIWRRSRSFGGFFISWIRGRDADPSDRVSASSMFCCQTDASCWIRLACASWACWMRGLASRRLSLTWRRWQKAAAFEIALIRWNRGVRCRPRSQMGPSIPIAWRSYGKLQRELRHLARKDDPRQLAETRRVWVQRARNYRALKRQKEEDD